MTGSRGFHDTARQVLRMSGADARAVLQGVVTNDVDRVSEGHALYAALLTPQGKYLFDFFILADGVDLLIDVAGERATALATRLKMYCLRRDAKIEPVEDLTVSVAWPEVSQDIGGIVVPDPRDPALGVRIYAPAPPALAGTRAQYDALRVSRGIPESGVELVPEGTFILEAGFERLNGVDFRKGCYVGQEVTARMKHKTELRKGLVVVDVTGTAPPGTELTSNGKPAGTLFTQSGGKALAHLRFDRASGPMEAGDAVVTYAP